MTREEFVRGYALRNGLDASWSRLGFIDLGHGRVHVALPCGCGENDCVGWAMVSAEGVLGHLELYAPEPLRTAYCDAIAMDQTE